MPYKGESQRPLTNTVSCSDCFIPEENNPYPLCIGRNRDKCEGCQLRADYEPKDPYGVDRFSRETSDKSYM